MAFELSEAIPLFFGFHTLGDDRQTHGFTKGNDGLRDGAAACIFHNVPNEGAINLQLVQRQTLQVSQRGIPGAKVVQGKSNAMRLELSYFCDDVLNVVRSEERRVGKEC